MIREVTVMGTKFKITYVTKETLKQKSQGTHGYYYGLCDEIHKVIYINKELKGDALRRTILHEVIHAFLRSAGLENFLKFPVEESICVTLENMITIFNDQKFVQFMRKSSMKEGAGV